MVATKHKPIEHYLDKIEAHLLRRYPHLNFRVEHEGEKQATLFYWPYSEAEDAGIIYRASGIATDALIEADYRIWVQPAD